MSDQSSTTPTPAQLSAEVRAAILRHTTDEQFAAAFGKLPPAARLRISRQFVPKPTRVKIKIIRLLK